VRQQIALKIRWHRDGYHWIPYRNGLITAYALPVSAFPTFVSALDELKSPARRAQGHMLQRRD
jgi:hypothetical protein